MFVLALSEAATEPRQIASGLGHYKSMTLARDGGRVAFLTDHDDYEAEKPAWTAHVWSRGGTEANPVTGAPEGWRISGRSGPRFSRRAERMFVGLERAPEPEPGEDVETDDEKKDADDDDDDDDEEDEPKVVLDVWHWKDPRLQPQQLRQVKRDKDRTWDAVVHLDSMTLVRLETEDMPDVTVGRDGDGAVAVGYSDLPYRMDVSWDSPGYRDVYIVDPVTGERERVLERLQARPTLSPAEKYLTWFDGSARAWFAMYVETGKTVNMTEYLPHAVHNEDHDAPEVPRSYGRAGWVEDDMAFLVYDRFDIWATNPIGFWPPYCVTDGVGRERGLRLQYVRLDPDERAIDPDADLLLSAFDRGTKASGFFRDRVRSKDAPVELVMRDERISRPRKARHADRLLYTRETFERYPDLWASDLDLADPVRLSDANPQQSEYLWGTAELVDWRSLDGGELRGTLYKPEGFDPDRKYPMLVYFYERMSDGLHRHYVPAGSRSTINFSFYVSRGYLVFVPDIRYEIGAPGPSAVNCILPGVTSIVERGFVDADRIGVQGHSWGGYQIAYLVTRTNIFRAAEAGAPVSNMTSAYGGIRWGSGMSRMFQYEKTQSRIGGTLWDAHQRYIENSPIFWADRIHTPLLMMHNDEDGAVPWEQGIELFVALRRLRRPAWMLNYNGEQHGLRKKHNQRDFAVRLQQFFDHYLQDAPAPVWLVDGIPATKKGETLGLEITETDAVLRRGGNQGGRAGRH